MPHMVEFSFILVGRRHYLVLGVSQHSLHWSLRCLLDGLLDDSIRRRLGQTARQVDHWHVRDWHPERHAGQLTVQNKEVQSVASASSWLLKCFSSACAFFLILPHPLSSGITLPTALAAPVEAGMMFWWALRPSRQALALGPSTVFWVAVYAWTVVCGRRRHTTCEWCPTHSLHLTPCNFKFWVSLCFHDIFCKIKAIEEEQITVVICSRFHSVCEAHEP